MIDRQAGVSSGMSSQVWLEANLEAQTLLAYAPDAIFIADIQTGRLLGANKAAGDLLQRDPQQFIDESILMLHPPRVHDELWHAFTSLRLLPVPSDSIYVSTWIVTRDGVEVPVEIACRVIAINRHVVVVGAFRNTTVQRETEAALRVSEERYRQMFETNRSVKLIINPQTGQIVEANAAACEFYGYSREQLLSLRITDINVLPPDEVQAEMERARTEERLYFRFRHRLASGAIRDVEVYSGPIRTGAETLLYSIIHDVTARHQVEMRLQELNEERLSLVLRGGNLGFWDWDLQTGAIIHNRRWATMLNYQPHELESTAEAWRALIHPRDRPQVMAAIQRHLSKETDFYEAEYRARTSDGQWRWILDRGRVLVFDDEGNPKRMVGTHADITKRKEAEQALRESEANMRAILNNNLQSFILLNPDRKIVAFNDLAAERSMQVYGQPLEVGRSIHDGYVLSAHRSGFEANFEAALSGHVVTLERRMPLPEGGEMWLEFNYLPATTSLGETIGVCLSALDITESKLSVEALKLAQDRARTLHMASLALGDSLDHQAVLEIILKELQVVVPFDDVSVQVLRDGYFETIGGLSKIGRPLPLGTRYSTISNALERRVLETQKPLILADVTKSRDFETPASDVRSWLAVPLLFNDEVVGKLSIGKAQPNFFTPQHAEVATAFAAQAAIALENARLFEEIRRAQVAAEVASQAKSEFLANMSHELRTPLNGILGYAQILQRDTSLTEQQQEAIDTIQRSGEHLLTMINDVLDLARIEAGKMELDTNEFHFPRFIKTIREISQVRAAQKGLNFICDYPYELPVEVQGDEKRLRQVLLNLLGNAIKFTPQGQVRLNVRRVGEQVFRFEVADTGIGIPADKRREIFKPFYQLKQAHEHVDGAGLGLAICRRILQLMNSELQLESEFGQGSRFWFDVKLTETFSQPSDVPEWASQVVGYHSERVAPLRLLLVDDKEDNLAVLSGLLAPLGFEISQAQDGEAGLDLATMTDPDLILMDLVMPVLDGFETTRRLREQEAFADVPIIALTAFAFAEARWRSLEAGCTDYLTKPIDLAELLSMLEKYLPLTWNMLPDGEEDLAEDENLLLVLPEAATLKRLHQQARIGDVVALEEDLNQLLERRAELRPFVQQLLPLVKQYQMNQIEVQLSAYLDDV